MTDITALLASVKANRESYEEFKKSQQEAMLVQAKSLFANVFEAFPFVEAIVWMQYTPYFNDGEACYFSVHEFYAMGEGYLEAEDFGYPEDHEFGIPSKPEHYLEMRSAGKPIPDYAQDTVDQWDEFVKEYGEEVLDNLGLVLSELQQIPDEIYESFGEGLVVVTKDDIEVHEYDHD